MKKLLLVLLFPLFAGAQIIEFADPNFKAYLLSAGPENEIALGLTIDTNMDGEIQVSEAIGITYLYISEPSITSIEGVKEFTNLEILTVYGVLATTFDLSSMETLTSLYIDETQNLLSVDLSGCSTLDYAVIGNIGTGYLNVTGCTSLRKIEIIGFVNGMIDLTPAVNLEEIPLFNADFGSEGGVNLSGLQHIQILGDWVGVTGTPYMNLNGAKVDSFGVESISNFADFDFNWTNCSFFQFAVVDSPLTSLDLSEACATVIFLRNNGLENIVFPSCAVDENYFFASIYDNPIVSIDMSSSAIMSNLDFIDNPNLQTVNLKNGYGNLFNSNSPNLSFVCVDEIDLDVDGTLPGVNPETVVHSYCSFTPGGDYNTISGTVRFDLNDDGCDDSDMAASQLSITIDDGAEGGSTFTGSNGSYSLYTNEGTFTLVPVIENTAFTVVPTTVEFTDNLNNTAVRDFCIVPNGMQPDLEVVILPPSYVSQASDPNYQILLRNKGNQVLSGTLTFNGYNISTFGANTTPPDSQNGSILTWDFSGLDPFETQTFVVAPYIPIFYAVGENFDLSASCTISGDVNPADNSFFITDYVDVAFDLRLAEYGTATVDCLQGTTESPTRIGDYLHYMVRFENTGTGAVGNAVAKLIIDETKFDVSTFQMLTASHASVTRITGNVVEIIFEDINLPTDDENNDGYAAFKIKTKSSLVEGDSVAMLANVYFDYNFPIQTEEFVTTFTSLGVEQHVNVKLGVYPNPARDVLNLSTASPIESFEIYDTAGRLVTAGKLSGETQTLDVSEFAVGIYLVKAKTASGFFSAKWVKE